MSTHTRVVRTSDDDTILKRQIIPVGIQTLIDKKNEMRDSKTTANRIELHEEKTCHYRTASLMHRDVSPRVICATNRRMDRKLDLAACVELHVAVEQSGAKRTHPSMCSCNASEIVVK